MTRPTHRVHGLADDEVAPDWPPLTAAEVEAVLAGFPGLRGPAGISWRSPRPLSAAARVRTRAGEVFIKRHHRSVRTAADLAPEHAFMAHLRRGGIPVPAVLADAAGETAIASGEWTYEVHALARGTDVYRDSPSWTPLTELGQARAAGEALARLHLAAAGFGAPPRRCPLLARDELLRAPHLLDAVAAQASARPALAAYLAQRNWRAALAEAGRLHAAVQPRVARLPRLWTHNDWHASNLFWSSARGDATVTAVLDFGLASPTFALFDLATAIERNAIAWLHLERGADAAFPHTAAALIEGYDRATPLAAGDRALLADLLPVVHLDYALSEVDYYAGITHSAEHADVAWHTFLIGHAAWFATPPGRALLGTIRGGP